MSLQAGQVLGRLTGSGTSAACGVTLEVVTGILAATDFTGAAGTATDCNSITGGLASGNVSGE